MPRLDGTGPGGKGPMTGRAMGYCTGYVTDPAYFSGGRGGIGFGRGPSPEVGMGRGFGRDSRYNPRGQLRPRFMGTVMPRGYTENPYHPPTKEQELTDLNNYKKEINTQLSGIEKRIKELSK